MKRSASIGALLAAAVALTAGAFPRSAPAADAAPAARPDFSGVWLPNAKASARWPDPRPYTKTLQDLRAKWDAATTPVDLTRDDDYTSCMPYTLPYMMTTITQYPFEIVSTPKRIYLFTETYGQVRRIDIDAPPAVSDSLPSRAGVSRGHWEGSQLVIETTNLLPAHEGSRYPASPALRVVERMSIENGEAGKQLVNEITFEDPAVYEKPVTLRMVHKAAREDVQVGEYICQQDLWDQHLDGSTSKIPWR
jgi:hypothetical protein